MMITKDECEDYRQRIKALADEIGTRISQHEAIGETIANLTLSYRHLEDASMRLGKAIQALDGGTSVYDKRRVPASQELE